MSRIVRVLPGMLVLGWLLWSLTPRRLPRPEALAAAPIPVEASVEGEQAQAILALIQDAYAEAATYRDVGWVQVVRVKEDDAEVESVEHFRVALARPNRLAWQWRERNASRNRENEFLDILELGDDVRLESSARGKLSLGERNEAFAMIAAWDNRVLLQLLFPGQISGRALLERLADARVVGLERVDGSDCFRIEATWARPADEEPTLYVLWVDRESHHLRRLFERAYIADWIRERTHVFSPAAGIELSDAELRLDESF